MTGITVKLVKLEEEFILSSCESKHFAHLPTLGKQFFSFSITQTPLLDLQLIFMC